MCVEVERPTSDSTYVPMEFKITRSTIRTNPVPYYGIVGNNVGYIVISTFAIENCSKDIKKALIELKQQGAKSIVLDLAWQWWRFVGGSSECSEFLCAERERDCGNKR